MKANLGKIFHFNIYGYKCYKDALAFDYEKCDCDVPIVADTLDNAKKGIVTDALPAKGRKWGLCNFTFVPTTDDDDITIVNIPELEKKVIAPDLPESMDVNATKNGD